MSKNWLWRLAASLLRSPTLGAGTRPQLQSRLGRQAKTGAGLPGTGSIRRRGGNLVNSEEEKDGRGSGRGQG